MVKSYRWGGGGGPCDFSVSPSPFGLEFGTLDLGLGLDNFFLIDLYYYLSTCYLSNALLLLQSKERPPKNTFNSDGSKYFLVV